jgi:hypothetical protein
MTARLHYKHYITLTCNCSMYCKIFHFLKQAYLQVKKGSGVIMWQNVQRQTGSESKVSQSGLSRVNGCCYCKEQMRSVCRN